MVLLDTCAAIWSVNGDPLAPAAAREIGRAAKKGTLFFSPVSAWEIGLLVSRGKLRLLVSAEDFVARLVSQPGVRVAALTPEIACRASFLPGDLHRDPADRLLVATALALGLRLVTRDERLVEYGRRSHVPVMACWPRLQL